MSVKISSCYYHVGRPAVAICAQCGAGICRECAVKGDSGRIICYRCGNSNLKQEYKKYKEILKQQGGRFRNATEFIGPGIIGILIIVTIGLLDFFLGNSDLLSMFKSGGVPGIIAGFLLAYMLFSIPFCMTMLKDRFAPKYETLHNRFDKWYFKVVISLFVGWIVLTVYLVRFIMIKNRSRKEEKS